MDPSRLTATQVLAALSAGQLSAVALARALLERIARYASLNAFIALDPDALVAAARESDARRRAGGAGPLEGLPLAVKDNIDTAGLPTSGGTPALKDYRPARDAAVLRPLWGAGALLLGKTNLHELAYGITNNNAAFGPARNPYDATRIAGGSSGGTAAAVAAGLAPAGLGTDTGGSVRIPAALCGLAGLRPTTLRWPQAGILPLSHTRDTAGPLARSVADLALLDGVVTGAALAEAPAILRGLRLGLPRDPFWLDLDPALAEAAEAAVRKLAGAGVTLVPCDLPQVPLLDQAAGFAITLHETVADLNGYLAEGGCGLDLAALAERAASPDVRAILQDLLAAGRVPEELYRRALTRDRPRLQAAYAEAFRSAGVEALLFPTTPLPASPIGEDETTLLNGRAVSTFHAFIRNCSPASVAGIPGLSLPAGLTANGLPVGLELDGPAGSDRRLLAIGLALEAVLPPTPPPLDRKACSGCGSSAASAGRAAGP